MPSLCGGCRDWSLAYRRGVPRRRRFRAPAAVLAAAVLVTGLASCGDESQPDPRQPVLDHVTANVIAPAFADLAARSDDMSDTIGSLCTGPTEASAGAAREALMATRQAWSRTRPYAFGPGMTLGLADSVDHWPVLAAQLSERIDAGRISRTQFDAADFGEIGLPALEQVLFEPTLTADLQGSVQDKAHNCGYLREASARVAELTQSASQQWAGYGTAFATGGADSVTQLVTSAAQYGLLTSDAMLSVPAGLAGRTPNLDLVREGLAARGVLDIRDGLSALRALYTGDGTVAGPGLGSLVAARSADTDRLVRDAIATADARVAELGSPLRDELAANSPELRAAVAALKDVQRRFSTDVAQLLGVTVTINDSDGD